MLAAVVPSLWAWMSSWFTPTVLFVLLNLVIGTIAVTSMGIRQAHAHPMDDDGGPFHLHLHFPRPDHLPSLVRSPSNVLERLKSIGTFRWHRSGEIPSETVAVAVPAPASTATVTSHRDSEAEDAFETLDEAYEAVAAASLEHNFSRSQSDSHPTAGEMPVKLPAKMKKSASAESALAHFEEEDVAEARLPATAKASHPTAEDEEVDARADDFINRFRQQLKLQRLDSFMRYKEMLTGSRK